MMPRTAYHILYSRIAIPPILWLTCLCTLSGCLPYGMVEPFASPSTTTNHAAIQLHIPPRVLLQVDALAPLIKQDALSPHSVGHQYMFGVIPFTSLYYQHGTQSAVVELALETIANLGATAYVTSSASQELLDTLQPDLHLTLSTQNISISLRDYIFFRQARVHGALILATHATHNGQLLSQETITIDDSQLLKIGHATLAAELFQTAVQTPLRTYLEKRLPPRHYSHTKIPNSSQTVTILTPTLNIQKKLVAALRASYGVGDEVDYTDHTISRLFQRGMSLALEQLRLPAVSLISAHPQPLLPESGLTLHATIQSAEVDTSHLQLCAAFELRSHQPAAPPVQLEQQSYTISVPLREDVDGALAVSLEEAASTLTAIVFAPPPEKAYDARLVSIVSTCNKGMFDDRKPHHIK